MLLLAILLLPTAHASTASWSSYTWNLNAHAQTCPGGTNCPTVTNGVLNTTMQNTAGSFTGTYNSNVYMGNEDWCGCTPTRLPYADFSVNGTFKTLAYSGSLHDYTLETSFYYYLPNPVNGTQICNEQTIHVNMTHWMDIEIFYSGRSGNGYIGCSSAGTINYREVISQTLVNQNFRLDHFSIPGVFSRALLIQQLPSTTGGRLAGVEIGVEGFGVSKLSALWYTVLLGLDDGGPGCFPTRQVPC